MVLTLLLSPCPTLDLSAVHLICAFQSTLPFALSFACFFLPFLMAAMLQQHVLFSSVLERSKGSWTF